MDYGQQSFIEEPPLTQIRNEKMKNTQIVLSRGLTQLQDSPASASLELTQEMTASKNDSPLLKKAELFNLTN